MDETLNNKVKLNPLLVLVYFFVNSQFELGQKIYETKWGLSLFKGLFILKKYQGNYVFKTRKNNN